MKIPKAPPSEDKLNLIYLDHQDPIQIKDSFFYLYRNWKACLVISFLVFLAVTLFFVFTTPKYQFKMVLEVGQIGFKEGIGRTLIDPLPKIKQSIEEIYIPRLKDYILSDLKGLSFPKISIKTIRESNLVMLKAAGTLEQGPEIINFLTQLKENIIADHNKEIALFMDLIESDLVLQKIELKKLRDPLVTNIGMMEIEKNVLIAENKLSSFQDQKKLTEKKLKEIERKGTFLIDQIKELRKGHSELERWKRSVAQEKIYSMEGLGYILVQNEITQIAGRLRKLQETLDFKLPMEELSLKNQANSLHRQEISQNRELQELVARRKEYTNERKRKIKRNLELIKRLEAQKVKFAFSRVKLKPYRVKQPISPRIGTYITIGIFLSVIMGIFLPMVYQFIKSSFREFSAQEKGSFPG